MSTILTLSAATLPFSVVILFKDGVFVLRAMPLQMPILSTLVALDIRGIGPHSGPRASNFWGTLIARQPVAVSNQYGRLDILE